MLKTAKEKRHLEPMEKLARSIIIRGWLDSIGHSVTSTYVPKKNIVKDANDWIGTGNYYYWGNVAGIEENYLDSLYTKFISGYNKGMLEKENVHALLNQLFERI